MALSTLFFLLISTDAPSPPQVPRAGGGERRAALAPRARAQHGRDLHRGHGRHGARGARGARAVRQRGGGEAQRRDRELRQRGQRLEGGRVPGLGGYIAGAH
jgi:hypothetical protein